MQIVTLSLTLSNNKKSKYVKTKDQGKYFNLGDNKMGNGGNYIKMFVNYFLLVLL